jgi:hypothetical protein
VRGITCYSGKCDLLALKTSRLYPNIVPVHVRVCLKEGKALGSEEDKELGNKYCDIIKEDRAVTKLRHGKQLITVTVFSVRSARIATSQNRTVGSGVLCEVRAEAI